jgi:hypothetical protein
MAMHFTSAYLRVFVIARRTERTMAASARVTLARTRYFATDAQRSNMPHNAPVQRRRDQTFSAPHVHNEMAHLRRAFDAVSPSAATGCYTAIANSKRRLSATFGR